MRRQVSQRAQRPLGGQARQGQPHQKRTTLGALARLPKRQLSLLCATPPPAAWGRTCHGLRQPCSVIHAAPFSADGQGPLPCTAARCGWRVSPNSSRETDVLMAGGGCSDRRGWLAGLGGFGLGVSRVCFFGLADQRDKKTVTHYSECIVESSGERREAIATERIKGLVLRFRNHPPAEAAWPHEAECTSTLWDDGCYVALGWCTSPVDDC